MQDLRFIYLDMSKESKSGLKFSVERDPWKVGLMLIFSYF